MDQKKQVPREESFIIQKAVGCWGLLGLASEVREVNSRLKADLDLYKQDPQRSNYFFSYLTTFQSKA